MIQEYVKNPAKIANDVKDMVLSGEVNPIMVKVMYDIFSDAMKDKEVKDAIMEEVDRNGKEFEMGGFKFTKASKSTYSYKHDAEWQRIEGIKKAREALMKQAIENEIADASTGELIPPAYKSNTEFIKRA